MAGFDKGRLRAGAWGVMIALAVASVAVVAGTDSVDAGARGARCANADATRDDVGLRKLRRAVTCLIRFERSEGDRKVLRRNPGLKRIAQRHTRVMLRQECFDHRCRGERPLKRRIERSGYLKGGGRYGYGENLGCSRTPAGMVKAWMTKRFHRRNILRGRFSHMGLGAGKGAPRGSDCRQRRHVTYTAIFAWRRR